MKYYLDKSELTIHPILNDHEEGDYTIFDWPTMSRGLRLRAVVGTDHIYSAEDAIVELERLTALVVNPELGGGYVPPKVL